MPVYPGDRVYRRVGSGTTDNPMIMWLVPPPRSESRTQGNETVARDLGRLGFTHIWIRSVVTRRGHRYRQTVRTDSHITVFCGMSGTADFQGDVYVFVSHNGRWRIMHDNERRSRNGRGVELYQFP
ncbi:hypothetical protein SPBR_01049 [Sporothrix brasiliensis 5110]|uniref:Uncharacterized protein n=1 Tax=Sporothrix brasiliensis 5110 TaxID=1398154 RepID=A0A0C2EVD0_9PEZI|nr:uncharacterized protein SPBR_01049 [Sporothrix brasiliensis 5110]KIH90539.1 hypothetical protein SPBR_01049 [Sporothrix brasiliensis 5110]